MGMLTNVFKDLAKEIAKGATDVAVKGAKTTKEGFNEVWYDEKWQKEKKELEAELKQNWQELKNTINKKKNKSDKDNDKFNFNF